MNRHILLLLLLSAYIFQICNSGVKFKYYLNLNALSAMTHSLCKENNILSAFAVHRLSLFPFCAFALLILNFTHAFLLCQEIFRHCTIYKPIFLCHHKYWYSTLNLINEITIVYTIFP